MTEQEMEKRIKEDLAKAEKQNGKGVQLWTNTGNGPIVIAKPSEVAESLIASAPGKYRRLEDVLKEQYSKEIKTEKPAPGKTDASKGGAS